MSDQPKILLSEGVPTPVSHYHLYVDGVEKAGGIAELRLYPEAEPEKYDGLLLCGGVDIHPSYYNEEINGSVGIDTDRDTAEFALAKAFIDVGKPVFGICRGFQLLNIYFGGSLTQHIDTADNHRSEEGAFHLVNTQGESFFNEVYGNEFSVNSYHHQAVHKLGEGLRVTLLSKEDGIVEGFEHESLPIFGVQFHPERMCHTWKNEKAVDSTAMFRHFIELCKK